MDNDLALLKLFYTPGLGAKTLLKLLKRLAFEKRPVIDLVTSFQADIVHDYKLKPDIVSRLDENFEKAESTYVELNNFQIQILYVGHPAYPDKLLKTLNDNSPPVLFVRGNTDLLDKKSVGFCGSRDISETGYKITERCASILAGKDLNIVSGFASGADTAAHLGALKAGGVTTIVLATGILQFQMKSELAECLDESNYLFISEFMPQLGWQTHNAMQRNKTVCGLSDAMILTSSSMKGGTFEAGKTALELQVPLYTVDYINPSEMPEGNKYFLRNGADALKLASDNLPILDKVLASVKNRQVHDRQISLF